MSRQIEVGPPQAAAGITRFLVRVDGRSYDVGVAADFASGLGADADPAELVRESFAFLLERESPASILSRFDLPVIARYFPEYEGEITRRLQRG